MARNEIKGVNKRQRSGAAGETRTPTGFAAPQILSLLRMPFRHSRTGRVRGKPRIARSKTQLLASVLVQ